MRIIKATETIPVEHPVMLLFGQPGIGKSSLGYSCKAPLLLDFDKGSHRAANRKDTLVIDQWSDIVDMMASEDVLEPYSTLTVDTVGRCLDVMIAHIAQTEPKKVQAGNPTQQGWGTLKIMFRTWMAGLRAKGKDVLLVAHDKEDKDGDLRIVRPDIVGGSYGEVLKIADFVGYMQMAGRERVLDFSPTERSIGKNPAGWQPFKVPPVPKAGTFMAELFDRGREALGKISEASADAATEVTHWGGVIAGLTTHEQLNGQMPAIKALKPPAVQAQVAKLLLDRGKELGLPFDAKAKQFTAKEEVPA